MAKKRYHNSMSSDPVPNTVSGLEGREHYAGYKSAKSEMRRDGAMIHEDRSAPCLLPRNVIDREWPSHRGYMPKAPMDLFDGANAQLHEDERDVRRELRPTKQ